MILSYFTFLFDDTFVGVLILVLFLFVVIRFGLSLNVSANCGLLIGFPSLEVFRDDIGTIIIGFFVFSLNRLSDCCVAVACY